MIATIRWSPVLVRLDALLALENGDLIEPGQLGVTWRTARISRARTALGQRLCLARWLVTSEAPSACNHPVPRSIDPATLHALPERWQQNWSLVLDRCRLERNSLKSTIFKYS